MSGRYNVVMATISSYHRGLALEVRGSRNQILGISPGRFLHDYWQKNPLLIRQAFPDFMPPIEPDELAGLACQDGVLARLISHDAVGKHWKVKNGPLTESDFAHTGDANWTLLVQDADKWDADVATLLASFDFLPSWRMDDIMISYADPGGGVGPHVDQYDVFLLQGLGQRHWAISDDPHAPKDSKPDLELKQLEHFEPTHAWLLEPGDMLYLPPGIAHHGVAVSAPCMTFSVGMRAASQAELITDLADYLADRLHEEQRYSDPDLEPARHAGEIDSSVIYRLKAALPLASTLDDEMLYDWFGRFITRYRSAQTPATPERTLSASALKKRLLAGMQLMRHPWVRMAWSRHRNKVTLYANGLAWPATMEMVVSLCQQRCFSPRSTLNDTEQALLLALVNEGYLVPHDWLES